MGQLETNDAKRLKKLNEDRVALLEKIAALDGEAKKIYEGVDK